MKIRGKHVLVTGLTGLMALALWGSSHQVAFAAYIPFTGLKGDVSVGADGLSVTVSKFNGGTAFGTMAAQNAASVAVTGGSIDGTTLGATTPASAKVTTLNASGAATVASLASTGGVSGTTGSFTGNVGGAAGNFSGALTSQGQVAGYRTVTSGTTASFGANDQIVCINKSSGSATAVTGPSSPVIGQIYTLIDCKGDAATNNITFSPANSGTVNGATSFTIGGAYNAVSIVYSSATTASIF